MAADTKEVFRGYWLNDLQSPATLDLLRFAHEEGRLLELLSKVGLDQGLFSPRYRTTQWLRRGLSYLKVATARWLRSLSSRLIPWPPSFRTSPQTRKDER